MNRATAFLDAVSDRFWLNDRLTGESRRKAICFIRAEYIETGSAGLRETAESLDNFRRATAGALESADDSEIYQILRFAIQRIRNYSLIVDMANSLTVSLIRIVAISDEKTSPICEFLDGKYVRLLAAAKAVPKLVGREPTVVSLPDVMNSVSSENILDDQFVLKSGIPPYHCECRTRLEAVIPGAGLPMSGYEQVRYDEWRRKNPDGSSNEWQPESKRPNDSSN
jgi:hypothetical protein